MISRTTKWVVGVHGAVLLTLMFSSVLKGCAHKKDKPKPLTIEIAMVSASAASAAPHIQEVDHMPLENIQPLAPTPAPPPTPTPAPAPVPTPTPPKPAPVPDPPKKVTPKPKAPEPAKAPTKKKWTPAPVVRQDTKVRNPNAPQRPVTRQQPKNIAQSLQGAMPRSITTTSSSSSLSGEYGQVIQSRMYAAWNQPSIATSQSHGALIRIRIEKNGMISSASLERSSGNALIDQTALQAAHSVRLPELPSNITQSRIEVSIEFMLTN